MYRKLILFLIVLSSSFVYADEKKTIEELAFSKSWLRLLYYSEDKPHHSIALGPHFFIHPKGKQNPLMELQATIKAFKENLLGPENTYYQCRFPARLQLLQKIFPSQFLLIQKCKELDEWLENIDAGELYLVYSSSYPNNPASMFGHTFLRFNRKKRSKNKETNEILGYSIAFLANPDPTDGPLTYTVKGILGGYFASLEIKPFYINIGMYNNSESRDLWEYPLAVDDVERNFLLKHIWELSTSATFEYRFFTENCSTFLLRLLEVIKTKISFNSKDTLFVVPTNTLKEVTQKTQNNKSSIIIRSSIERRILHKLQLMSDKEKSLFKQGVDVKQKMQGTESTLVLDSLVDYWKLYNYQTKLQLNDEEKRKRNRVYVMRANIQTPSISYEKDIVKNIAYQNPQHGHDFSKVGFTVSKDQSTLNYRYGFHTFDDPFIGYDEKSQISFFDVKLARTKEQIIKVTELNLVEILSLQNFNFTIPKFSWGIKLFTQNDINTYSGLKFSFGVANLKLDKAIFLLPSITAVNYEESYTNIIEPGLDFGYKQKLNSKSYLLLTSAHQYYRFEKVISKSSIRYFHKIKETYFSPQYSQIGNEGRILLSASWYY